MTVLTAAILSLVLVWPASADWDPGDPAKWVQMPDETEEGIYVSSHAAEYGSLLADDFLCTETGWITGIHIWGDNVGLHPFARFVLAIYSDIPADQSPTGHSMPGDVLWESTVLLGDFTSRIWSTGTWGWFEPPDYYYPAINITCRQYNISFEEGEGFFQLGSPDDPVVYWLSVQAFGFAGMEFVQAASADHWNDDAVFVQGVQQPYVGEWDELRYPPEHPYAGASIDLAFVIAGTSEETDWGDAPDPTYPTLASSNGAFHAIVAGVHLGTLIDAENDGLPDPAALGDDNDNLPDEDGVIFTSPLNAGLTAALDVVASVPGSLSAWIDFGGDGSWAEPTDQIFFSEPLVTGVNPLVFAIPINAVPGTTYARFRFSTVGGLTYTGMAVDGEIEDYEVEIEGAVVDWGDAPDPGYPTLAVNDGAYHMIDSALIMGLLIDDEVDGQPDANALGDDTANLDDEDGVVFTSRLIPGETASVDVYVSAAGKLNAWIAFRLAGWGGGGAQIFTARDLLPGRNSLTFDVPFNAQVRTTFARFRFSTDLLVDYTGGASDGEVEDYEVEVKSSLGYRDWGDAPAWYGTFEDDDGPSHVRTPGFFLGALIDGEQDGQPQGGDAQGDDTHDLDDEDGVIFLTPLVPGEEATIEVVCSAFGRLDAWVDFDADGDWGGGDAQVLNTEPLVPGVNTLTFTVPADAELGTTFARFRLSADGGLSPLHDAPNGEVEDYQVEITEEFRDWGDAPDPTYPTLAASGGANHLIVPGVFLGLLVDIDPDGQPDPNALGDDNDGGADEDGVVFTSPLVTGGTATIDVMASVPGLLDAWVDFGDDGSWGEPGDQVFASQAVAPGLNALAFAVPPDAMPRPTFARFRFGTVGGLPFDGPADDGEVEDYIVTIWPHDEYKWLQRPDLTDAGIDVSITDYMLADDFLCEEPGLITGIRIWGSWLDDDFPPDPWSTSFLLRIYEDIPADESPTGYSIPGEVLWDHYLDFYSPQFSYSLWAEGLSEGWMDPPDSYVWPGDSLCWFLEFDVPEEEAFEQQGSPGEPVVYWLAIQSDHGSGVPELGWKTSTDHWNDNAVHGYFSSQQWDELVYPPEHPLAGSPIDLAFALEATELTGVPDGDEEIPRSFGLRQNVPNPFNPTTTIAYDVPAGGGHVTIEVFDASGRRVTTLADGHREEGRRSVTWHGVDDAGHALSSGIYFYRMTAGGVTETRKMVLLK